MMTRPIFDPDWRIADDLQKWLFNYLWQDKFPINIVEFGSGASTIIFAHYAAKANANVTSYEQSYDYLHKTRQALSFQGLYADTHFAPIKDGWYDPDIVESTIPDSIDLALIDGPGPCVGRTREPAMEFLYPRLAPGGLIVLDDGRREMEQLYVEHWQEQFPGLAVEYVAHDHGTYLIRKG